MANSDVAETQGALSYKSKIIIFSTIAVLMIALYGFVPYGQYILYPFTLLSTFVHEMGHGITAEILGGDFVKFEMYPDGSGVASMRGGFNGLQNALTAMGGLIGPALMAMILFIIGKTQKGSRIGLWICALASMLCLIFFVRNLFGILFVICVTLICALGARFLKGSGPQVLLMVGAETEALNVFTRMDYLFVDNAGVINGEYMPSDVAQIANNLFLPYWFWGGFVALISVGILFLGLKMFLLSNKKQLPPQPAAE